MKRTADFYISNKLLTLFMKKNIKVVYREISITINSALYVLSSNINFSFLIISYGMLNSK